MAKKRKPRAVEGRFKDIKSIEDYITGKSKKVKKRK